MSDETTPDLRGLIQAVLDRTPEERTGKLADELAVAIQPELDRLTNERDLAIAHDTQPYPTASAYEQACKALHAHRERAEKAEATNDRVRAVLDQKDSDIDRAELTSPLPLHRRVRISEIRAALDPCKEGP